MSGVVAPWSTARGTIMAKLFYVIGASGAGKDSLIDYLREKIPNGAPVVFARRYITRAADAGGENHIALSTQEFLYQQQQGCFSMSWYSHENYYGISSEIDEWLAMGLTVVVNGSREYLAEAASKYKNIVPILVCVDPVLLSDRLFARGRESFSEVTRRVAQAIKLQNSVEHPHLRKIDNNAALEEAGAKMLQIIQDAYQDKCA